MTRALKRAGAGLMLLVCAAALALGLGMTPGDARRIRAFADAVRGWQVNPDYRAISAEYVTLGVEAMQARPFGVSADHLVMGFRSIPGLPAHLAISDSSSAHYDAFSRGDVSAYLHLASEQGLADGITMIAQLGRREPLTDEDLVTFLAGFKLPVPTITDAGAVESVRRLLADVQPTKPFTVRGDITAALRSHVDANLAAMTREQQSIEFTRLDARIRAADPELWRSKQVSDFLAGIWAQGYGQVYLGAIDGMFRIQRAARYVLMLACVAGGWLAVRRYFRTAIAAPSHDAPPPSAAAAKRE